MRTCWYWPHQHRGSHPLLSAMFHANDATSVQALAAYGGERVHDDAAEYEVYRDLPDPRPSSSRLSNSRAASLYRAFQRQQRRHAFFTAHEPDVCIVETLEIPFDALSLPLARRAIRSAFVGVVHDVRPHDSRLPRTLETMLLRRLYSPRCLDVLVAYHDSVAAELVGEFGVDPQRISIIPILCRTFEPRIRRDDEATVVQFMGTFRANKGVRVLVDAIRQQPVRADVQYRFAGRGLPSLERSVNELVAERPDVTAEIGQYTEERANALLRTADLLVLPYTSFHSQSGVLADAYAHSVPLLVTDVGALGPTVRTDGTGWVAPPGDSGALSRALVTALDHRSEYELRRAAIRTAVVKHLPQQVAPLWRQACERAVLLRR